MNRPDLLCETRRQPDGVVVRVAGEIDVSTASRLGRAIEAVLVSKPPAQLVLDLGGVTFCDSHGISLLVLLSRRLTTAGSQLVLLDVRESLLRALNITGLRQAFLVREAAA